MLYVLKIKGTTTIPDFVQIRDENNHRILNRLGFDESSNPNLCRFLQDTESSNPNSYHFLKDIESSNPNILFFKRTKYSY